MTRNLDTRLSAIAKAEKRLMKEYADVLRVNPDLDRSLVSFQANKTAAEHRWCKYKEGFSVDLMHYVFDEVGIDRGMILDPFAGSGTTLFVASDRGLDSIGVELLPSSAEIIEVRQLLRDADKTKLAVAIEHFRDSRVWEKRGKGKRFEHLRITSGAFPADTERQLGRYLLEAEKVRDDTLRRILKFAAMCVLESISFTRKDGQYLRWDWRSGRRAGKTKFDKGVILTFSEAIAGKLSQMAADLSLKNSQPTLFDTDDALGQPGDIELLQGTCLQRLPQLRSRTISGIVTSPPYCNRYDYTRSYALELAFLGVDEDGIKDLRQTMVSCTVENREKTGLQSVLSRGVHTKATQAWQEHELLQQIFDYLNACRAAGELNNNGIPRMVENYFKEMAMVIFECCRLLKPGKPLVMVNDNVRYQGAHLPVDLILSDFARHAGFDVDTIWVLPRGKGNSSQQMGRHGRQELRKCVYIWRKRSRSKLNARPARFQAIAAT